jgi:hypothetical protein
MKTRAFSALLGFAALAASGCRTPTSVTISVTTDATCAELKGVSITARAPEGIDTATPSAITKNCSAQGTGSRIGTLVIVPSAGDSDEIAIKVVAGVDVPVEQCTAANGYQGCIVARRLVRFASHVELTIPIVLRKGCKDVPCAAATTCVDGLCKDATVSDPQTCTGEGCLGDVDAGADVGPDGDASETTPGDTGPSEAGCGTGQKNCGGACVGIDDPAYGCGVASCSPCATFANATYACAAGACAATGCQKGFKSCGGVCVAADAAHGCSATACDACPAVGGTASCDAAGACKLTCDPGYKLCGGKCVSIGDPTYGCGATTCDNSSCPTPGTGGTVVCSGSSCILGSCGPGTKACGGACVPTDVAHGCGDVSRCTACANGQSCVGGPPTTCQCVPEPTTTTCAGVECGTKINNCGQTVDCGGLCGKPQTCGGGGVPNQCGCTPTNPCDGVSCGTLTNNCALQVSCGCTGFNTCGGGGTAGKCGCISTNPCNGTVCGSVVDSCGKVVTCSCTAPNTCGGGGVANQCGCKPIDQATACNLRDCGTVSNGCGGYYSCGKCLVGEICSGGICTCKTCP